MKAVMRVFVIKYGPGLVSLDCGAVRCFGVSEVVRFRSL